MKMDKKKNSPVSIFTFFMKRGLGSEKSRLEIELGYADIWKQTNADGWRAGNLN